MSDRNQESAPEEIIRTLEGSRAGINNMISHGLLPADSLIELDARLAVARALRDRHHPTATSPTQ